MKDTKTEVRIYRENADGTLAGPFPNIAQAVGKGEHNIVIVEPESNMHWAIPKNGIEWKP